MNIAILFDDVASRPKATPDELGVMEAVDATETALRRSGHETVRIPAGTDLESWSGQLRRTDPHAVFNLCEGLGGRSDGEVLAARIVEELGIPMTGSPSATLALARRKDRVNGLLEENGLPVPHWALWEGFERARWAEGWNHFPAIVKPAAEDGSVGITQESVVYSTDALAARLLDVATLAPLLVQAFVGSREINVGVVGDTVLPLAEIVFHEMPPGFHPMVGYEAKWAEGSAEDLGTRPVCPAPLSPDVEVEARSIALEAWEAVGGRGYGRVDLRLTEPDTLHILEINPNPDMAPSAGLTRMARTQGWDYAALVERILAEALAMAGVPL
jgi:D-alanine-D-alanine ligase